MTERSSDRDHATAGRKATRRRLSVVAGLAALFLVVSRVVWEVFDPLSFEVSKAAIYVRDVVTLVPAGILGMVAVVMIPGRSCVLPAARKLSFGAAGVAVTICALISRFALLGIPHIADEAAYLWQAELLSKGRLWAVPPGIDGTLIQYVGEFGGKRISAFFMGSSIPLAFGHALGVPWLVDPVLAGLLVLITAWAGGRLFDRRVGVLAGVLLASSPFLLFQGASYFSHVWTAGLTVAAFTFAVAPRRRWDPLAAGALTGAAMLSRPVSAAVLAIVIGGYWLITLGPRRTVKATLLALLGALPFVATFLWVNRQLTGSWMTTAHQALLSKESIGLGPTTAVNAAMNSVGLTVDLVGISAVGLLLIVLGCVTRRPEALAVAAYGIAQLGAYSLYPYHGISYGPRFLFEVAPLLIVLCALGVRSATKLDRRSIPIVGLAVFFTLAGFLPTRLMLYHQRAEYLRLPEVPARSLVFISAGPYKNPDAFYPAFVENGVDPEKAAVLYVRDEEVRRCAVMGSHPDRDAFLWDVGTRQLSPVDRRSCTRGGS